MTGKKQLTTAIIIPAYNEQDTIGDVISRIPREKIPGCRIIVVDDGSQDATRELSGKAGADEVISFTQNRGLGVAFQKGVDAAVSMGADYVVNIDADGQFSPQDIPRLLEPVLSGQADVSVCSRFRDKELEPSMPYVKKTGNKFFSWFISWITGMRLTDTQCGFRAYNREAALNLNIQSKYTYTQEAIIELAEKGFRITEVPLNVKGQRKGKSKIVDSSIKYGMRSSLILLRTIRDYHPLRFFGGIGAILFSIGLLCGVFLALRLALTGLVYPYRSLVTFSAMMNILGFIVFILALLADMQNRQRRLIEKNLYIVRRNLRRKPGGK